MEHGNLQSVNDDSPDSTDESIMPAAHPASGRNTNIMRDVDVSQMPHFNLQQDASNPKERPVSSSRFPTAEKIKTV